MKMKEFKVNEDCDCIDDEVVTFVTDEKLRCLLMIVFLTDPSPTSSREYCSTWSDSPLWNKQVRAKVKDTKLTEHQLNISRSQKLVPGITKY